MSELLPPATHNQMPTDWFRDTSLEMLKSHLSEQTYPGYPQLRDRLRYQEIDGSVSLTLPSGPWDMSDGVMPTSFEQADLSLRGLQTDELGRPLHPWFELMITDPSIGVVTGRGAYWHWGPNFTADPIVVRYDADEPQVLLIERQDGTGWALPGGFVDKDEGAVEAAVREAGEETGLDIRILESAGIVTYRGPLADLRVTAHAWPETTAVRFDVPNELVDQLPNGQWKGFDDAKQAGWFALSSLDDKLFGSHQLLIQQALGQA